VSASARYAAAIGKTIVVIEDHDTGPALMRNSRLGMKTRRGALAWEDLINMV
jgi:hypothetical protein